MSPRLTFHLEESDARLVISALTDAGFSSRGSSAERLFSIAGELHEQAEEQGRPAPAHPAEVALAAEAPADPTGVDCAERYEGVAE